jgi:hypothetical protein
MFVSLHACSGFVIAGFSILKELIVASRLVWLAVRVWFNEQFLIE